MLSKKQPIVVESQFPFYVGSSSFRRRKTNRPKPCLLLLQHTSKASASQLQPPDTETPIYVGGTDRELILGTYLTPPLSQSLVMTKHIKCFRMQVRGECQNIMCTTRH